MTIGRTVRDHQVTGHRTSHEPATGRGGLLADARARLRYLEEVLPLLYPPADGHRPWTLLPHRLAPRRLVPRAWWHATLGSAVPVANGPDTIETYLREVLGRPIRVTVHVRPARRANRKPVLEARDATGLLAFVKIGESAPARALVRHENDVLRMLAGRSLAVVVPPAVLHHGVWRGLEVLAVSALPVTSRPVPQELRHAAVAEIAALGEAGQRAWHGDFTPWNVAAGPDGRLLVWDWERFTTGVPFGFDAVHYFFHSILRRMRPAQAARTCLAHAHRVLEPFGLSSAEARRTAAHYLITLADRYHRDVHEPLGPPANWLNPLVDYLEGLW